jgi:argininosuccinate lyase
LSRLSEDLIIYSTKEFNFVKLSGSFSTGSSLMPNKFNPDSLELVRGLTGGIFGQLTNIIVTLKALPSTYNKDMQNDKQSAFFVFDNILLSLKVILGVIESLDVNEKSCWNALSYEMLATDLAHYMVKKGVTFRDAHHFSSRIVDYANNNKIPINKISMSEMKVICDKIDDDVYDIWSYEKSVEQYQVVGGTSLKSVKEQIYFLRDFIEKIETNEESQFS